MMMSMYSAVSGLKSQQTKLNVIGNNIANINTLGYKSQNVSFSDLLSQTVGAAGAASGGRGGTNAKQIGLGTQVSAIGTNMNTGSSQYTGSDTDAALSGSGFFIVQGGGSGRYQFTRAGNFGVDVEGNLVVNGLKVCGWNNYSVDASGNVTYNTQSDVSAINVFGTATKTVTTPAVVAAASTGSIVRGTIGTGATATVPTMTVYPTSTTNATVTPTLTKTASPPTGVATQWTWSASGASGTLNFDSSGNLITTGTLASTATGTMTVSGVSIPINLSGLSIGTAATPSLQTFADGTNTAVPASTTTVVVNKRVLAPEATTRAALSGNLDINAGSGNTTITMYDSLGTAHEVKVTFTKSATPANTWTWQASSTDTSIGVVGAGTITFNADGTINTGGSGTISALTTNGSNRLNVAVDFSSIAQYTGSSGASNVAVADRDGYSSGTLQGFSIGTDGIVQGSYSNGQRQPLGEVGLAVFTNPEGMEKIGENLYTTTVNSGDYSGAVEVGTGGAGGLTTGALEMSNVDLASEFSEMMITQRAYQANSKIITTSDTLLETLINMSR